MKKEFDFSKEFGEIDGKFVECAGKEWSRKKCSIFQLYSRKMARVAVFALLCLAVACNSGVQAAVREFTTKIGEAFGFREDLSSYTKVMNQKQTKNGISLTLKEAILDDRVLAVCVHMDFGEEQEGTLWVNDEETLINGQRPVSRENMESATGDGDVFRPERDSVLVQIYEDQILPDGDVKVHLVLEGAKMTDLGDEVVLPDDYEEQATEFVYDFVITPEELRAKTVKQDLDVTVGTSDTEGKNFTLKELTMNDLYCRMTAEGITWDNDWPNQYELKLKGTDNLGNPVSFEWGGFLSDDKMMFATDFFGDFETGVEIEDDECRPAVPDKACDYIDLQLYERKMIWDGEEDLQNGEEDLQNENEKDAIQESGETWEMYLKEENYGWKPVGEPFRITIAHE